MNTKGTIKVYGKIDKQKTYRVSKLVITGVLVLSLLAGGVVYKHKTDTTDVSGVENEVGYTDVNLAYNTNVKEDNFVVLDVGNYDDQSLYMESKIKYCKDKDISLGIIIDCDADSKYQVYNDIELAKKLITKYNIDFPIYISIDKIMENENIDTSQKSMLIKSFIDKAIQNGMNVGIKGTDTNLCNFNNYCFDITSYNIYLKKESKNIIYNGTCSLVENLDGTISNNMDVENMKSNNEKNFIQDAYYIMGETDTVEEVALSFDLSINDLLKFNDIELEDIKQGTILRIPNDCQKVQATLNNNINEFAIKKGVDLSYCQTHIDWNKLKFNADFAIIKAIESTRLDPLFESHIQNCKENDIPIGIYSITRATTVEEIKNEAYTLVELLKDIDITYPVYIDFEVNPAIEYERNIFEEIKQSNSMEEMLQAWADIVEEAGFIPGIYCNKSVYKSIYDQTNSLENNFLDRFQKWISGTNTYSNPCDFTQIQDPGCSTNYQDLNIKCNMRQVSEACTGIGAATALGYVDFNYCYTDYEQKDYSFEKTFSIKGFDDKNIKSILANIAMGGALLVIAGGTIIVYTKVKKKQKRSNKFRI